MGQYSPEDYQQFLDHLMNSQQQGGGTQQDAEYQARRAAKKAKQGEFQQQMLLQEKQDQRQTDAQNSQNEFLSQQRDKEAQFNSNAQNSQNQYLSQEANKTRDADRKAAEWALSEKTKLLKEEQTNKLKQVTASADEKLRFADELKKTQDKRFAITVADLKAQKSKEVNSLNAQSEVAVDQKNAETSIKAILKKDEFLKSVLNAESIAKNRQLQRERKNPSQGSVYGEETNPVVQGLTKLQGTAEAIGEFFNKDKNSDTGLRANYPRESEGAAAAAATAKTNSGKNDVKDWLDSNFFSDPLNYLQYGSVHTDQLFLTPEREKAGEQFINERIKETALFGYTTIGWGANANPKTNDAVTKAIDFLNTNKNKSEITPEGVKEYRNLLAGIANTMTINGTTSLVSEQEAAQVLLHVLNTMGSQESAHFKASYNSAGGLAPTAIQDHADMAVAQRAQQLALTHGAHSVGQYFELPEYQALLASYSSPAMSNIDTLETMLTSQSGASVNRTLGEVQEKLVPKSAERRKLAKARKEEQDQGLQNIGLRDTAWQHQDMIDLMRADESAKKAAAQAGMNP